MNSTSLSPTKLESLSPQTPVEHPLSDRFLIQSVPQAVIETLSAGAADFYSWLLFLWDCEDEPDDAGIGQLLREIRSGHWNGAIAELETAGILRIVLACEVQAA